jgi:hypothetical protein
VDLLLAEAPDELLGDGVPDEQLTAALGETPCDVALLASRDATPQGPVLVPFGGAEHDWAAVELATRWHREGLGAARLRLAREAAPPTLLVRRGLRPGGLAPPPALTHFTWSIRP